jgi:hypothetical protein
MLHAVMGRRSRNFLRNFSKRVPHDKFHSTTVNLHADRPKSNHASQPRTAFLNDAMQHEHKFASPKRIVIAKLHDGARNHPRFPLAKCNVIAKAARRNAT